MTLVAFAFLQHQRLAAARREKKESPGHRLSRACRRSEPASSARLQAPSCYQPPALTADDASRHHTSDLNCQSSARLYNSS
jgi:hypothetical protein